MCYHYTIGECLRPSGRKAVAKIKRNSRIRCNHPRSIIFGSMMQLMNLIGGELTGPEDGRWLDNIEPATGLVFSQIPRSNQSDVERAVQAAQRAFPAWSSTPLEERAACLRRWGQLIAQHSEKLIASESQDNGKPVSLARSVDIPRAQKNLEFFAGAIEHFASESHIPAGATHIHYTHRKPIGVVGCISPWNLPLYLFTWKIAPALAAGNCVIAKPSEVPPLPLGCSQHGLRKRDFLPESSTSFTAWDQKLAKPSSSILRSKPSPLQEGRTPERTSQEPPRANSKN